MLPKRLDTEQVLYYLGHKGQAIPTELKAQTDRCCEQVLHTARPKWQMRRFALTKDLQPCEASLMLTGQDIRRHLSGCHELIVLAVTLGAPLERLLMRAQVARLADAVIMDAAASCAVEAVCDRLEGDLRCRLEGEGLYLTGRFSPGYGDLPLALQRQILLLTDAGRQMGLTVTETDLLVPRKSVTALLGVSKTPVNTEPDPCAACSLRDHCQKRKEGICCGR